MKEQGKSGENFSDYLDWSNAFEVLEKAHEQGIFVLVIGPKGTGKTTLVREFAKRQSMKLESINFSLRTRESHLVGSKSLSEGNIQFNSQRLGNIDLINLSSDEIRQIKQNEVDKVYEDDDWLINDIIDDLINKMGQKDADICVAHDGSIMHATFAMMKSNLSSSLEHFLDEGGRKMALWYRQQKLERVDVSDRLAVLTNLNKPEDLDF